jgi:hypothetical protein
MVGSNKVRFTIKSVPVYFGRYEKSEKLKPGGGLRSFEDKRQQTTDNRQKTKDKRQQ